MVQCFGLWLEMQGYSRTLSVLNFGARAYMRYMIWGLSLAIGLQILHLGFTLVLQHPPVPGGRG
jgi:hypothetical protein